MPAPSQRLRSSQRLRAARDFLGVRNEGLSRECGPFLLQLRLYEPLGSLPRRRLGVIASKRLGGAVERNRAKRRLREVFRRNQEMLPPACDVVLVARQKVLTLSYAEVAERFVKTVARLTPPAESA